ncbi:MAG: class I SAM-dependent methyltransferase [Acidimicrobiia bacterium]|nr:class I SAM-dependent methyltransferase [Acidimicrobiia bacterium]
MTFARAELDRVQGQGVAVDIGCGAARNAVPLAEMGWAVIGTDLSQPMLEAAIERATRRGMSARVQWLSAPMEDLPIANASAIWSSPMASGTSPRRPNSFERRFTKVRAWPGLVPRCLSSRSRVTRCLTRRPRCPESPLSSPNSPDGRSVSSPKPSCSRKWQTRDLIRIQASPCASTTGPRPPPFNWAGQ